MKFTILFTILPLLVSAAPTEPQAAQIGPAITYPFQPDTQPIPIAAPGYHAYEKRLYKETYYVDLFNKNYMWVMIEDDKNGTAPKTTRWEHRAMLTTGGPSVAPSGSASASASAVRSSGASNSASKPASSSVATPRPSSASSKPPASSSSSKPVSSASAPKSSSSAPSVSKAAAVASSSSPKSSAPSSASSKPPSSSAPKSSAPSSASAPKSSSSAPSVSKPAAVASSSPPKSSAPSSASSKPPTSSAPKSSPQSSASSKPSSAASSSASKPAAAISSSAPKASAPSSVSSKPPVSSAPKSSSPSSVSASASKSASASSASVPAASGASSVGVSAADRTKFLTLHNDFRAKYSAGPLAWDDTLAAFALKTAQSCKYGHTGGPYGENIAAGVGGGYNIDKAFSSWANEDALYDFSKPGYSSATGHFTAIVWKNTAKVGCAAASCADGTIFTGYRANSTYVVCNYQAPGNVVSSNAARTAEIFTANVGPKVQ